jgi:hypothetical protein
MFCRLLYLDIANVLTYMCIGDFILNWQTSRPRGLLIFAMTNVESDGSALKYIHSLHALC